MHIVRLVPIHRSSYFRIVIEEIYSQEGLELTTDNLSTSVKLGDLVLIENSLSDFEIEDILSCLLVDIRFISGMREFRSKVLFELSGFSLHFVEVVSVVLKSISSQTSRSSIIFS